jgi:hypothetical protein
VISLQSVRGPKCDSNLKAPACGTFFRGDEVVIPGLNKLLFVLDQDSLNVAQFLCAETEIAHQGHWPNPELGRLIVSVNVHMRWFAHVMAIEVKGVVG